MEQKLLTLFFFLLFSNLKAQQKLTYKEQDSIIKKGELLINQGKYISSIKEFKKIFSDNTLEKEKKIDVYYKMGYAFLNAQSADSARYYFNKGDKFIDDSVSTSLKARYYHNKASVNYSLSNIDSSMYYALKALSFGKKTKDLKFISMLNANIGQIFLREKDFFKSKKYFEKSLNLANQSKDSIAIAESLLFFGQLNFEKKEYKQAEEKLKKALDIFESKKVNKGIILSKGYLSKVYYFNGNMNEAVQIGFELLALMNKVEITGAAKNIIDNTNEIVSLTTKDTIKEESILRAQKLAEENITITKNPSVNIEQKLGLLQYFEENKNANDFKKLPKETSKNIEKTILSVIETKDSLYQASLKNKYAELETKYQAQEKEKENLLLKTQKAQQELVAQKANTQKWWSVFISVIAILGLLLYAKYAQSRKKQLLFDSRLAVLKAKQEEQEEIGIELHDNIAKRLESISIDLEKRGSLDLSAKTTSIKNVIRKLSRELSIVSFEESPFTEQIITLASSYQKDNLKIKLNGLHEIPWKKISNPIKYNLFLIIREAVSNSYNHANASIIKLKFDKEDTNLVVCISDNGKGIDMKTVKFGRGMRNINTRVKDINAVLKIDGKPNEGTEIKIKLQIA